jgi:hypothetical protein
MAPGRSAARLLLSLLRRADTAQCVGERAAALFLAAHGGRVARWDTRRGGRFSDGEHSADHCEFSAQGLPGRAFGAGNRGSLGRGIVFGFEDLFSGGVFKIEFGGDVRRDRSRGCQRRLRFARREFVIQELLKATPMDLQGAREGSDRSRASSAVLPARSLAAANPLRSGTVSRSQTMTLPLTGLKSHKMVWNREAAVAHQMRRAPTIPHRCPAILMHRLSSVRPGL